MRTLLLLIGFLIFCNTPAEQPLDALETAYQAARKTYRAHHYDDATRMLETLLQSHADCARCAHLLGKAYGRLAQRANWLSAMDLARKTCSALELAVRLGPDDQDAIDDLLRYYRTAPEFLGGGQGKARILEQRLRELQTKRPG